MREDRPVGAGGGVGEPGVALERHLAGWLGRWPPRETIDVVESEARQRPGWDGAVHPVVGVLTPGGGVLSVPPGSGGAARRLLSGLEVEAVRPAMRRLAAAVGRPGSYLIEGVYRYGTTPPPWPDIGTWRSASDRVVPEWLRPFGGEVLLRVDEEGRYLAGVGLKRHDAHGHEIAVGTEPEVRGKGLARRLVAQAARAVLADGAVPTYIHALDNAASARVAEAAGFPDRGWRMVALVG